MWYTIADTALMVVEVLATIMLFVSFILLASEDVR